MSTLLEIEAAADALPLAQKQELMRFLAAQMPAPVPAGRPFHSKRGFPISRGRTTFTSEDVARIEAEAS